MGAHDGASSHAPFSPFSVTWRTTERTVSGRPLKDMSSKKPGPAGAGGGAAGAAGASATGAAASTGASFFSSNEKVTASFSCDRGYSSSK